MALSFFSCKLPVEIARLRTDRLPTSFYLGHTADRWLHYGTLPVTYGYILFEVLLRFLDVGATIILLWATFELIWTELEGRFSPRSRGNWFLSSKIVFFSVIFTSLFYLVLFLALAIVWLLFLALNVMADIALRRNQFEVAMDAIFCGFGLLTVVASVLSLVTSKNDNAVRFRENKVGLIEAGETTRLTSAPSSPNSTSSSPPSSSASAQQPTSPSPSRPTRR
jgi:hypothetical protein